MAVVTCRNRLAAGVCLLLLIICSCHQGGKKNTDKDIGNFSAAVDTTADVKAMVSQVNSYVMANRLEDAIAYITPNLHRFSGSERAILLNERGNAYLLKDDTYKGMADYLAAHDLDPDNLKYLLNISTTYEQMGSESNAAFFAKKVLDIASATDSDRAVAERVMAHADETHRRQ